MIVKQIVDEDFINYKKPSLFVAFPKCSFKCEKECGIVCCQNSSLANSPDIEIDIKSLVLRYTNNYYTDSIVCGGLEPMDSWDDLYEFIKELRMVTNDDIVIYTGYFKDEIVNKIALLLQFKNIIIKYGRFIPNQKGHIDKVIGVELKSDSQYAEKIS